MKQENYESFYALTESPFSLTPDPRFLFQNKGVHEILRAVLYGLETQKGIMAVIGEAGTGKTTVCRALLELLPPKFKTALLLDPNLSEDQLLRAVVEDLGIPCNSFDRPTLMSALEGFLLQAGQQGHCAVVILDEAQHLSSALLEQVRILSNFETPTRKLVQVVLVGQKELEEKLLRPDLRQVNQRIGVRCRLAPLSRSETVSYIEHRLRLAGMKGKVPLSRSALQRIWAYSGGIPRLINLACDHALAAGFVSRSQTIGVFQVGRAIENLSKKPQHPAAAVRPSVALGCLFLAYMGAMALFWNGGGVNWLRQVPVLKSPIVNTTNVIDTEQTLLEPLMVATAPSPRTTERLGRESGDERSELPRRKAPQSHGRKSVVRGSQGEATSSHKVLLKKLFRLWGINNREPGGTSDWPSKPDGTLDVRLVAARHGLEADLLTGLSWSDIKTIGLPGILHWDDEAEPYLLIGLENGSALLVSPAGKEITRSISELETKPIRFAWFLWRNRDGWSALPTHEWSRRRVTVFAARLHELGYLDYPLPSTYDERISRAVHRFQQKNRLAADGILGARTAMVLDRLTDRDHIPQLIKGNAQ